MVILARWCPLTSRYFEHCNKIESLSQERFDNPAKYNASVPIVDIEKDESHQNWWIRHLSYHSLTGRFFSQLAGARAPLQAKIRDMEDEMQHLQDKLGKVKADNQKVTFYF